MFPSCYYPERMFPIRYFARGISNEGVMTIVIHRDFNVINGYVQVPPNHEHDKTRVTLAQALATVPSSQEQQLSLGSGPNTGSKFGAQRFLRLPPLDIGQSYLSQYGYDPQVDLRYPR